MSQLPIFITGNPEKASNFARHIGLEISHQSAELDEIQTTNHRVLVEHKIRQAYQLLQKPVIVEDVLFTFEAWGSLPGPFVKYFINETDGVERMCRMLDGFDNRRAFASCTYAYFDGKNIEYFTGRINGTVSKHPRGSAGYGFDQLFEPDGFDGKTAAELDEAGYDRYYTTIKPFDSVRQFLMGLS